MLNRGGERMSIFPTQKIILFVLLVAGLSNAQVPVDVTGDGKGDSGFRAKWDAGNSTLVVFRDVSSPDIPSARIVEPDGRSTPIFILRDFREAKFADIWAATSTPEGGVILSVIIGFGKRPTPKGTSSQPAPPAKTFLLTYGADGALKKVWNVAPYLHQALAIDPSGTVFALGTRDSGPEGFPMLIKYSHSGTVLGEYVPSKTFANGAKALDPSPLNGGAALLIRNQSLILWVPSTREAFRYSLGGELQRKVAVGQVLDRLAIQNGFVSVTVAGLELASSSDLIVQIRLWRDSTTTQGAMLAIASLSSDGQTAKLLNEPVNLAGSKQTFLGVADDGKPVVLDHDGKGKGIIRKQ